MAKSSKTIQQKAKPSVVYEYVYDVLKNKLSVTKHTIWPARPSGYADDIVLDNGALLSKQKIFGMNVPTPSLFVRYFDKWEYKPECAFLAGWSYAKLKRGDVLDVAHRICKGFFEDRVSDLSRDVRAAQANLDDFCERLKAADAFYRAYAEKLEKTDE